MRLNIFGFGAKDAAEAGASVSSDTENLQNSSESKSAAAPKTRKGSGKAKLSSKVIMPPATTDSLKKRVKWLLSRLEFFKQNMEPALASGSFDQLASLMEEYFSFIHTYGDSVAYDTFEIGPAFSEYHEFFNRVSIAYTKHADDRAFEEIIDASIEPGQRLRDLVSEHVRSAYSQMEELSSLVPLNQFRSILTLGSGKVPAALFYFYDQSAIPAIVATADSPESVDQSNSLLRKFNLDRARVIQADPASLDYSYFDAIYFGPFEALRRDVMKRIRATARPNATIILRDPILTGSIALEKVLPLMEPAFTLEKMGDPVKVRGRFMLRHFVLKMRS